MKAHLRTNVPSLSDAKNQRRVVSNESGVWVMVYESAGDIWITQSNDNGATWYPEQRLNFTQGAASNPTLSNMFRFATYGQTERVAVCWVEQSGGQTVAYLQTITPGTYGIMYGWVSPSYERAATSYGLLSNFGGIPRSGARPVLWLEQSGNDILLQYALEVANSGIKTAKILFRGNGANTMYDDVASGATLVSFSSRNVSSNTSDANPVIITYPSAFGYTAKSYVYYLGFGYASGNRIVQYDYWTQQSLLLPTAYGDYTYYSLQGAVNPTSASFGLVAEAFNNDRLCVNYYSKPTYYGSSAPSLATVYTNMRQPTLMAEKVQSFGTAIVEINLRSSGEEEVWYKSNGSPSVEYLGSSIAGIFAREHVFSGDRATMAIRTNTSPAAIERFTGEGGDVEARSAAFAFYSAGTTSGMAMLDLDGAQAETIDSLQTDQTLVAMKFYSSAAGGDLAHQADSLAIPLRVDLSRNGVLIRSIPASRWTRLTTQSLPQFRNGDVLSFRLSGKGKRQWGYRQVSVRHAGMAKAVNKNESVALPTQFAVQHNYPNPFNPSTTISFDLPENSNVRLIVYDVLGREVAQLVNGAREAGYHSATWDASIMASGVYFARFTATDASGNVRLNKVTKLLLTK